jgi:hypothetical protein
MTAKLKLAWKMASGDVFDESYLGNFAALAQKKDKAMTKWMQTVITTYDVKADPATHEVNCVFHFAKAAQSPRYIVTLRPESRFADRSWELC